MAGCDYLFDQFWSHNGLLKFTSWDPWSPSEILGSILGMALHALLISRLLCSTPASFKGRKTKIGSEINQNVEDWEKNQMTNGSFQQVPYWMSRGNYEKDWSSSNFNRWTTPEIYIDVLLFYGTPLEGKPDDCPLSIVIENLTPNKWESNHWPENWLHNGREMLYVCKARTDTLSRRGPAKSGHERCPPTSARSAARSCRG